MNLSFKGGGGCRWEGGEGETLYTIIFFYTHTN